MVQLLQITTTAMTREQYLAKSIPSRLTKQALINECNATIHSWGMTGISFKVKGNHATVLHPGGEFKCMRWDLVQLLNELAIGDF